MQRSGREEMLNEIDRFVTEFLRQVGTIRDDPTQRVVGIDSVVTFPYCGQKHMDLFDAPCGLRGLLVELVPSNAQTSFLTSCTFPSWFNGFPVFYRIKEK